MSEFSNFLEAEALDHLFGEGVRNFTAGTNLRLALLTAVASDSSTGTTITEPSTGGYARKTITFGAATTGTGTLSTSQVVSNSATITFTNSAATTWAVVGIAIVDAATNGNMYCFDNGMTDANIAQNEKIQFTIGDIKVALD